MFPCELWGRRRVGSLPALLNGLVMPTFIPSTLLVPSLVRQRGAKGVSQAGQPSGLDTSAMFGGEDKD